MTDIDKFNTVALKFDESKNLYDSGFYREALDILIPLEREHPTHKWLLIHLAKTYESLECVKEAEIFYKKAVSLYPELELASLQLFHFLWNRSRRNEAMEELARFQSVSHSNDYTEIVREINEKL